MISFEMLSVFVRALFALWALLLCLVNISSAVLAAVKKRYLFIGLALCLFASSYFIWQVIFDFSLFDKTGKTAAVSSQLCALPQTYWLCAFALLSIGAVMLFYLNIRYDKTNINPGAIKHCLDQMPCGICCWRENGRVLFKNICMNELCIAITNAPLLNGNQFCDAIENEIIPVADKVWRFARRELSVDGERLFEMIASDITVEYAKTEALERDRAELSRLNQELREYYLSIDESVQHREILQAKINIHDEMNRLMLLTVAADSGDIGALDNIFSLWEQNALLLCMEADGKNNEQQIGAIESIAGALGIRLVWKNSLPENMNENERELFFFAAQEAIINAVKHARAKEMEISFEIRENALICSFTNDGVLPESEIRFEGGLRNLSMLAQKQGAKIRIEIKEKFSLCVEYHPIG